MWQVKLTPPQGPTPTHKSENTLMADITKPKLSQWYHATLFSPIKQTLIQAIKKGYFTTSPYLTIDLISNHLPQSMTKAKGHMQQTRKNLKSTNTQELKTPEDEPTKPLLQLTNTVLTKIIDHKRKIATYLTGKFPVT